MSLSNFKFKVLTEKTLPKKPGWVYYGVTTRGYETMSRNMAEMLRWIQEAQWRLNYYKGTPQNGHGTSGNEVERGKD